MGFADLIRHGLEWWRQQERLLDTLSPQGVGVWLVGIGVAGLLLYTLYVFVRVQSRERRARWRMYRDFGVPFSWSLVGCDLGTIGCKPMWLRGYGLVGAPDTVFMKKDAVIIGDLKSRSWHGRVTDYERYQLTLYMGIAMKQFPNHQVEGRIRYRDRWVRIDWDPELFEWLLSLKPEMMKHDFPRVEHRQKKLA